MAITLGTSKPLTINSGYNPLRFDVIGNATAINLFNFEGAMIPTAGYESIDELSSTGKGRGIFYSDVLSAVVVVVGNQVFKVTITVINDESSITNTLLGTLQTLTGKVYISENSLTSMPDEANNIIGGQLVFSDSKNIYVYSLDNSFVIATDNLGDALPFTPGIIDFQSDFFFSNDTTTNRIYSSNLTNGLIWNEEDFSTIGGVTRGCTAFEKILFVFGKDITDLFLANPALQEFPYQQDVSRAWEYGLLSPSSLANALGVMAWLGNSRYSNAVVLSSQGDTPQAISTPGIDSLIDTFKAPEKSTGFIYQVDGHLFYQLNFDIDRVSILYDFTSSQWTRLAHREDTSPSIVFQTAFYENENRLLAISSADGNVYDFGLGIFTHDGQVATRTIITQNNTQDAQSILVRELRLELEQGANQNLSKVCLSISKDNGRTYVLKRVITLGKVGEYKNMLRFLRLGRGRWWTFKFDFFSLDRFVILGATIYTG